MNKIYFAFTAFLLLALSGYAGWHRNPFDSDSNLSEHRKNLRVEEVTVIGEKAAPEATWLGRPSAIVTDAQDLIYIADRDRMQIRVFDGEGNYLRSIGERGRKPGQLRSMLGMDLNAEGQVVVGDLLNGRITTYSRAGEFVAERNLNGTGILWPTRFHLLGSEVIFLTRLPRTIKGKIPKGANYLFHVYDSSLKETAMFGEVAELAPEPDYVHRLFAQGEPGYFWPIEGASDPAIIYAPGLYTGNLYRFDRVQGTWRFTRKLKGFITDQKGMKVTHTAPEHPLPKDTGMKMTTSGVSVALTFHSLSLGVFADSQDRIVHFAMMQFGDQRKLVVQQFSPDGQLAAYDILESTATKAGMLDWEVKWKDRSDRYYLVEYRPDPVVKSVRLRWGARSMSTDAKSDVGD